MRTALLFALLASCVPEPAFVGVTEATPDASPDALPPGVTVRVRSHGTLGQPIEGAHVELAETDGSSLGSATTDATGTAFVPVGPAQPQTVQLFVIADSLAEGGSSIPERDVVFVADVQVGETVDIGNDPLGATVDSPMVTVEGVAPDDQLEVISPCGSVRGTSPVKVNFWTSCAPAGSYMIYAVVRDAGGAIKGHSLSITSGTGAVALPAVMSMDTESVAFIGARPTTAALAMLYDGRPVATFPFTVPAPEAEAAEVPYIYGAGAIEQREVVTTRIDQTTQDTFSARVRRNRTNLDSISTALDLEPPTYEVPMYAGGEFNWSRTDERPATLVVFSASADRSVAGYRWRFIIPAPDPTSMRYALPTAPADLAIHLPQATDTVKVTLEAFRFNSAAVTYNNVRRRADPAASSPHLFFEQPITEVRQVRAQTFVR